MNQMNEKSKLILLLAIVMSLMTTFSTHAKPVVIEDKCKYLSSFDPMNLHKTLTTFSGAVMGKQAEHWAAADYANLISNAYACNELPVNVKKKVKAKFWESKLRDAEKRNIEINSISLAIANAYGEYWKSEEEFPACATFLKWERDDLWYTNNAKEIFGKNIHEMEPNTLAIYKRLAQECVPVMELILKRWRITPELAQAMTESILFSIELDSKENIAKSDALTESLRIYRNGRQIPISYLRKTTQDVVNRINRLEISNRVMPTNTLIQISKWASQVIETEKAGPDKLYAQRIRKVVSDHMFKSINGLKDIDDTTTNSLPK